ncbi:unnamed protein product [Ilex paraguariensis]|uniref:AMP-binding enzyme C-terminal domain-containing protein n=1 Tax=Ilex paraguariensis TaxID=185542 RepID=A0ABC8R8V7_9AQUA
MTEACSSLTFKTLYDPTSNDSGQSFQLSSDKRSSVVNQPGCVCVGKPAPHIELKVVVEDSSHVGRILTRGPHVMLGYWGQISTRASNPSDAGWLDTGDIGQIDDNGNVLLFGRTKGRIKSGGENVYPEELEAVLSQHPGVSGIVVVGLPDPRLTEMVVACIQLKDNWQWADLSYDHPAENKDLSLSSEILQIFCREKNLTGFKIPQSFILWRYPLLSQQLEN